MCSPCVSPLVVEEDGISCEFPHCEHREYVDAQFGQCVECEDYKIPDMYMTTCIYPGCPPRYRISREGKCKPCEDFTILDDDKLNCSPVTC